ncbi:hypothetical protein BDC45DRAFT_527708 [Circinella umbellata]|nr:hypothetical protein BDC45DRAFT_527708 [Circinella umbellata]
MLLYGNGDYMLVLIGLTQVVAVIFFFFLAGLRVLFYSYFCLDDIYMFYAYCR